MKPARQFLHREDGLHDSAPVQPGLTAGGINCAIAGVEKHDDLVATFEWDGSDLSLPDFNLPAFDELAALETADAGWPAMPFIFVPGTPGGDRAVDSLKSSATG
jgi:DNA-binding NtrC family response regulator